MRLALGLVLIAGCWAEGELDRELEAGSADLVFVPIEVATNRALFRVPARMIPTATSSAEISFVAPGVVRAIFARPGDHVERDAPVVSIASPELTRIASRFESGQEMLGIMEKRVARLEILAREQIASQEDLQVLQERLMRLRGDVRGWKGELRSYGLGPASIAVLARTGRVVLNSPVPGVVRFIGVRMGESIRGDGPPLAVVVGAGRPRVEATFPRRPERGLRYMFVAPDGEAVELRPTPTQSLIDPETGNWTTWFDPTEDVRIAGERVGMVVARGGAFLVPLKATVQENEGAFVVRESASGGTERIRITILNMDESMALVRGDLSPRDRVALEPQVALHQRDLR
ncbi:MAG: efflux RND transporter periplasmic adaptor subunit [Myxococcota bacterium]